MDETDTAAPTGRRLRLAAAERERVGEFTCRARITLLAPDGARYEGRAELPVNEQNLLRVAALAALEAVAAFLRGAVEVRLVGLRSLRIFDTAVVAVQINARAAERQKLLLGIALASEDSVAGTARAVLHATNRLIGDFIER